MGDEAGVEGCAWAMHVFEPMAACCSKREVSCWDGHDGNRTYADRTQCSAISSSCRACSLPVTAEPEQPHEEPRDLSASSAHTHLHQTFDERRQNGELLVVRTLAPAKTTLASSWKPGLHRHVHRARQDIRKSNAHGLKTHSGSTVVVTMVCEGMGHTQLTNLTETQERAEEGERSGKGGGGILLSH